MIRTILDLYVLVLIADVVLSYLPQYRRVPAVVYIRAAANFTCRPIKKLLPKDLPFDFSPLIVIFALNLIKALW
jgi:YggT family protein